LIGETNLVYCGSFGFDKIVTFVTLKLYEVYSVSDILFINKLINVAIFVISFKRIFMLI